MRLPVAVWQTYNIFPIISNTLSASTAWLRLRSEEAMTGAKRKVSDEMQSLNVKLRQAKKIKEISGEPQQDRHVKSGPSSHQEKELPDQVTFVILTRDNNYPNPYGSKSETYGPLSWPAVAEKYNAMFGTNVGSAAMEKRARIHRDSWLQTRPDYPRKIVYAEKIKQPRDFRRHKPQANDVQRPDSKKTTIPRPPPLRKKGWQPPNDIRNGADVNEHLHDIVPVPEHQQCRHVTIEVLDEYETPLQVFCVPTFVIRKSSGLVKREIKHRLQVHITLLASVVSVALYVRCIQPTALTTLPIVTTAGAKIAWDSHLLVELYAVAAQFEDSYVQNLVLNQWLTIFEQGIAFEIDVNDLNHLFECTNLDDSARSFWTGIVCLHGLEKPLVARSDCHWALQAELQRKILEHRRN